MKKLSIEEKAKAYDEVVNKLKGFMAQGVDPLITRADVQDFFPELKESEDERIRKMLIEFFGKGAEYNGSTNGISDKEVLAWLEKQGEQKHQYKSRPRYVGEEELLGANNQGEQKSAENEELTEFDKAVGVSIGTWNPKSPEQIQSVKAVSKKLLKLAKKQINDEQKPAEWSEEDEKVIHCLEYTVRHFYEDEDTIKWCCDWLKSFKSRVQPRQEWSEEDKDMLRMLLEMINTIFGNI